MAYLFPFEQVEYGSRIILYGAGKIGRLFWNQIRKTKYCKIVCVVDKNFEKYSFDETDVVSIDQIGSFSYDKIVVSIIDTETSKKIRVDLVNEYHVDFDKIIIIDNMGFGLQETEESIFYRNDRLEKNKSVQVAFSLGSGLGDMIIAKKFIRTFLERCPNCVGDVYLPIGCEEKATAVFHGSEYINSIIVGEKVFNGDYDVSLYVEYFPVVRYVNKSSIQKKSIKFLEFINGFSEKLNRYGLFYKEATDNRIHFDRCRILKKTAFTSFDYGNGFSITDSKVRISLIPEYEEKFNDLNLRNYITVNYGWGGSSIRFDHPPNKVWPFEYYEILISMIHKKYPSIEIVQIGMQTCPKMEGVDKYALGYDLETLKYILRGSMLHVDCEGGLVHLATQLGTKCLVLFGPTPVYYFGYEENINIVSSMCSDCYFTESNFSTCLRNFDEPICMRGIMPEVVMEKIERYLGKLGDACG